MYGINQWNNQQQQQAQTGQNISDKYLAPITVAGNPLDKDIEGYKMDSTEEHRDMRKDVGLGTCNCCDFFQIQEKNVLLIEETKLIDSFKNLRLQGLTQNIIIKLIRYENRAKAYGSMLVLCRLAIKFQSVYSLLKEKPVVFVILVSSDIKSEDDSRIFDYFSTEFRNDLRSSLTREVVEDVEIGNPDWFKEKYLRSTP